MSAPRSILKRAPATPSPSGSPTSLGVHFPPSPSLCRTFQAYSPTIYDRTPIQVSKNSCALPERNGRTYLLDERIAADKASRGYHRSATHRTPSIADLPQLIPDMSSESDESDGYLPSPQLAQANYSYAANGLPTKYQQDYTPCDQSSVNTALSFLPYPASPRTAEDSSKPRKKRSESKHRQSGSDDDLDRIPSSPKSVSSRRQQYLLAQAALAARDDGCLGGF